MYTDLGFSASVGAPPWHGGGEGRKAESHGGAEEIGGCGPHRRARKAGVADP